MTRRTIPTRERVAIFQRWDGLCCICWGKISVGEGWDLDHTIPLAQGGEDEASNLRPVHRKCHAIKTKKDAADTAKAKRREAVHLGAKQSRNPMPFGRNSRLKRKLDGRIVER